MESPKKLWKDYLKENKGFSGAAKVSFENYQNKYLKDDDEYPRDEKFSTKILIPGKIYTFHHFPKTLIKENNFLDKRPVILSLGLININDSILEGGINFNVIPNEIRISILETLHRAFKNQIENNEKKIGISNQKPLPIDYKLCVKLFNGLGFETAFNVFDRRSMKDIKIFDYSDWVTIISLNTKGILGVSLNQIFEEYIQKMVSRVDRIEEIKKNFK